VPDAVGNFFIFIFIFFNFPTFSRVFFTQIIFLFFKVSYHYYLVVVRECVYVIIIGIPM